MLRRSLAGRSSRVGRSRGRPRPSARASAPSRSGCAATALRARPVSSDRSSAPRRARESHRRGARSRLLAALRRLRMTAVRRSLSCWRCPLSTVSGILTADRDWPPRAPGAAGARASLPARSGPVSCRTSTSRSSVASRRRRPARSPAARATAWRESRRQRQRRSGDAAGSSCTSAVDDATRLAYAEVLADEKRRARSRSCAARSPSSPVYGVTSRARAHRQRLRLPLHHPRARLPRTRHPPPPNPAAGAHRPTARRNASSAPCSEAGPTRRRSPTGSSAERRTALDGWLQHYNHHRPHRSLSRQPPITRLNNRRLSPGFLQRSSARAGSGPSAP